MHPMLIGLLGFVLVILFIGLPLTVFTNLYKTRQKGDGTWCRAILYDRTGTIIADEIFPKDREVVHGWRRNEKGKKVDFDYFAVKGYVGSSLYPPFRGKFWQVSVPCCTWIEGVATPPDIIGEMRDGGKLRLVDSGRMTAMQRAEKATQVAMQDAEALAEASGENKKGASTLIIVIGFVIVLIALIAIGVMMNGKLGDISGQLKDLMEALVGTPTPTS